MFLVRYPVECFRSTWTKFEFLRRDEVRFPGTLWIIILELNCPQAYTKMYVGIVRIGVRVSRLAILTTKYTLHTSIPPHTYNSLTLKVTFTAIDANTNLYDSITYSTVQKQLLHSQILPRKRARRARSARLVACICVKFYMSASYFLAPQQKWPC